MGKHEALNKRLRIALFLTVGSISGCATMVRGTKSDVSVESTPAGAQVMTGPNKAGTTPVVLSVDRDKATDLTVSKDGYDTGHVRLQRSVNPWFVALDIVLCPLACISLIVDAMSGALNDVEDRKVMALTRAPTPVAVVGAGNPLTSDGLAVPEPAPEAVKPPASSSSGKGKRKH